jgi:hypothetical protein
LDRHLPAVQVENKKNKKIFFLHAQRQKKGEKERKWGERRLKALRVEANPPVAVNGTKVIQQDTNNHPIFVVSIKKLKSMVWCDAKKRGSAMPVFNVSNCLLHPDSEVRKMPICG